MEKEQFTVVGLGEILWDMLSDGKKLGGAPANFAYHAQQLGAEGVAASRIGNDELGAEILSSLDELGLGKEYITSDNEHRTGTVTVQLDQDGKPNYTIHENVAWDYIGFDSKLAALAEKTDAVCFGSLCQRNEVSRNTIQKFLKATKSECLRIFDINLRQSYFSKEIIQNSLNLSNVLKLNDEELPVVAALFQITGDPTDMMTAIAEQFDLLSIALTRGEYGSLLYRNGEISSHSGIYTRVVDTVGAGDAFTAAIAMGLLKKQELDAINGRANLVASFVCSQSGATPKLPESLLKVA